MMKIDTIVSKESILDRFAKLKKKLCSLNAGWGDTPLLIEDLGLRGSCTPDVKILTRKTMRVFMNNMEILLI